MSNTKTHDELTAQDQYDDEYDNELTAQELIESRRLEDLDVMEEHAYGELCRMGTAQYIEYIETLPIEERRQRYEWFEKRQAMGALQYAQFVTEYDEEQRQRQQEYDYLHGHPIVDNTERIKDRARLRRSTQQ